MILLQLPSLPSMTKLFVFVCFCPLYHTLDLYTLSFPLFYLRIQYSVIPPSPRPHPHCLSLNLNGKSMVTIRYSYTQPEVEATVWNRVPILLLRSTILYKSDLNHRLADIGIMTNWSCMKRNQGHKGEEEERGRIGSIDRLSAMLLGLHLLPSPLGYTFVENIWTRKKTFSYKYEDVV